MSSPARQQEPREKATSETQPFPWEDVMGFLMGVLGWPPQVAWAATPREVALALNGRHGRQAAHGMNGDVLAALMQEWPD